MKESRGREKGVKGKRKERDRERGMKVGERRGTEGEERT